MSYTVEQDERLVANAKPRFKDFRVDFEKISNAACTAAREGRDGLDPVTANSWFHDFNRHLRLPLQRHYAEQGAWDAIVKYHSIRFKNYMGRDTPWPDPPAQATLDLFAERARADLGVDLVRTYIDMQLKRLRKDLPKRNPRAPRKDLDEGVKQVIGVLDKVIAGAIPDRKRELMRDLETVEPYITAHGGNDDRGWLGAARRELWMERRA